MNAPIPAPGMRPSQHEHLQRYLKTGGEDGHLWLSDRNPGLPAAPTLILTTTGRTSGTRYLNPLIYGQFGSNYVVIASKGGAPAHPAWYLNLMAGPEVDVQVKANKFRARARVATGEERTSIWKKMAVVYPPYDEYQAKAGREIPVVVLEPLA